jgi:hypothetical protein
VERGVQRPRRSRAPAPAAAAPLTTPPWHLARHQEEAVAELGRELRRRAGERHRVRNVLARHYRGREEGRRLVVGGDLVQLGHVVHDPVHLLHQLVHLALAHGQLRQARDVEHLLATNAHALSHSRSSPA